MDPLHSNVSACYWAYHLCMYLLAYFIYDSQSILEQCLTVPYYAKRATKYVFYIPKAVTRSNMTGDYAEEIAIYPH